MLYGYYDMVKIINRSSGQRIVFKYGNDIDLNTISNIMSQWGNNNILIRFLKVGIRGIVRSFNYNVLNHEKQSNSRLFIQYQADNVRRLYL